MLNLFYFKNYYPRNKNIIADGFFQRILNSKKIAKKRNLKIFDSSKIEFFKSDMPKNFIDTFQSKSLSMAVLAARLSNLSKFKIKNKIKKIEKRRW